MHGAGLVGGPAPGRKFKAVHREVEWPAGTLSVTWGNFLDSLIFFPIAPVDFQSIGGGEGGGFGTFFSEFFFFSPFLGAGRGEGDPETRGTSCAIPSWNVPKSIFRSRSRRKSVTKCDRSIKSVTERGEGGTKKCHLHI